MTPTGDAGVSEVRSCTSANNWNTTLYGAIADNIKLIQFTCDSSARPGPEIKTIPKHNAAAFNAKGSATAAGTAVAELLNSQLCIN